MRMGMTVMMVMENGDNDGGDGCLLYTSDAVDE